MKNPMSIEDRKDRQLLQSKWSREQEILREQLDKFFEPFYWIYFTISINTMLEEYFQ